MKGNPDFIFALIIGLILGLSLLSLTVGIRQISDGMETHKTCVKAVEAALDASERFNDLADDCLED